MFTPTILIEAMCAVLNTIPTRILAHYPFRDKLRIPMWGLYLMIAANMLLHFLGYSWFLMRGYNVHIIDIVTAVLGILTFYACIRVDISKLTFIYLLMANYMMILRGITVFVRISLLSALEATTTLETLILLTISFITVPPMIAFLDLLKERVLRSNAPQLWKAIWIIPATTTVLVYLFTIDHNPTTLEGLWYLLARVSLLLIFLIMYYYLVSSLDSMQMQKDAEEKSRQQEQFIALQHLQYLHLTKQIEETRAARHDLRQHLNLISAYLDKGDMDALRDYIKAYGKKIPSNTWTVYSLNYTVDTIIRYYAEKAEFEGITFEYQLDLPETLAVPNPDICVLLGNLLENAIEACQEMTESAPFIRINAAIAGEQAIAITVDNSCRQAPTIEQDQFLSTKHEGIGVGTLSIRNIAATYDGLADFRYENGVFYASVFLNP